MTTKVVVDIYDDEAVLVKLFTAQQIFQISPASAVKEL